MSQPFETPEDIAVGNIRIEVEVGNTTTVWIWIVDDQGRSIEGGAFDYAEFEAVVRAYYEKKF